MNLEPYIIFKDEKENLIATYGDIKYEDISMEEMPQDLINALISLEDRRFFHHFGIDIFSIFRALFKNLSSKKIVEGGSTITQQLAKNLLLHQSGKIPKRSYIRKIREAMLALKLERKFTKREIVNFYLNRVYFGSRTYGINAACWKYFGKSVKNATLFECACLVSLLQAPSRYASDQEKLNIRINSALKNMVEQEYITNEQKEVALLNKSHLMHQTHYSSIYYFTDWIVGNQIPSWIIDMKANLEIITTIDINMQQHAYKTILDTHSKNQQKWNVEHISLIASDHHGAIKSMVGGVSYSSGGFNRATQAMRQTGSAFKFFVYLSALRNGINPETLVDDSCPNINGWAPSNYYHKESGFLPMKEGLIKSINGITVRLAHHIGIDDIIDLAHELELSDDIPNNLSVSLGSSSASLLELVKAFGVVPNKGKYFQLYGIKKIINKENDEVLFESSQESSDQVVEEDTAREMGVIMQQIISRGTGKRIKLSYPAAGKSGSSQEYRDFWFVGFTPNLLIGTWCGNDDYLKPMKLNPGPNPSVMAWRDFALKTNPTEEEIKEWNDFFKDNKKYKVGFLEKNN
ncbi:transglycosylase domain-containing protein [Candidatus Cytomitobacter indipagum]|nr:transglycosylase domain-containing protein [Candidatus Cytomitobacter indipagum]